MAAAPDKNRPQNAVAAKRQEPQMVGVVCGTPNNDPEGRGGWVGVAIFNPNVVSPAHTTPSHRIPTPPPYHRCNMAPVPF